MSFLRRVKHRVAPPAAGPSTLTSLYKNLRQFQLSATEREWQQLMYYDEMLDLVRDVPGDVAEFGVAGGVSLISLARFQRVYERGLSPREQRSIYGFDSFEGLPDLDTRDTSELARNSQMKKGGFHDPGAYGDLYSFVENEPQIELIHGWFEESLPRFLASHPHIGFALVYVDCDLYQSTKCVLESIWPYVVPGGVIAFDELYDKDFPGEAAAFREFFPGKSLSFHKSRVKPSQKYLRKLSAPEAMRGQA